ncbi:MAG TPA: threonine ammonia-lyase [Verrucomicrobiae bacterium]|nr:threonine ammonia-lyase [Verrucomicrobiae bacterium]
MQFNDVRAAAERIRGHVYESPCPSSIPLSEATGMQVFCKLEYLQRTGSFKERGARNALLLLPVEQRKRGIVAASAGNHALGLAYHSQLLGIPATVVMPRFAPLTKVVNCRRFGARVLLHGANLGEARQHADEVQQREELTYINGYDDPPIIAGQGTIGLEVIRQVPDLDAIIVPVGGGGLIAGIALVVKHLKPDIKVIGVEPERAASFTAALKAGQPVPVELQPTLADGLAVAQVGGNAFAVARDRIDRMVTVCERDLALAVLRLAELEKGVVEGAGAAGLAACLAGKVPELKGKRVALPLCGGNIDLTMLGRVLDRGLASDGRLCRFTVTISDRPGGLARFASIVAEEGASFVDINHDRAFGGQDLSTVSVHCIVETEDASHIERLRVRLNREGFESNGFQELQRTA